MRSGAWPSWQGLHSASLHDPLLTNSTTVLDLGLLLVPRATAAASGSFDLTTNLPLRTVLATAAGRLLMGYGARLAYGCNIGSYFGGIASFSLHGWVWAFAALAGTWLGSRRGDSLASVSPSGPIRSAEGLLCVHAGFAG